MYEIKKISSVPVIDFAAEELRKYLRMMMPDSGNIKISYDTSAVDGFRLGLMQDFGLDVSDAMSIELDDLIYIDTNECGGIIAGDNPRSILLAVYEFLRQNGARWLFPGVDGEYIPLKKVSAVKYRHLASSRYRGPCIEGALLQQELLDTIDFIPKVGMNVFMMQFFIPDAFYMRRYNHVNNPLLKSERITTTNVIQWKAQCETEMSRRGIQFHDVGHAWTADPLGIPSVDLPENPEDAITPEARQYIAMMNGERKLYRRSPLCTNFCMSNAVARKKIADYLADYAKKHSNVDYLHVWLADFSNNHCECEACQKKTPSDWYMILMNDIDEALSAANLDTRIVFIAYVDTMWAPLTDMIKNTDRFSLMVAPISRSWCRSLTKDTKITLQPYERNKLIRLDSFDKYMAHLDEWQKVWHGANFSFEYYMWTVHQLDVSGLEVARRIYEDLDDYALHKVNGVIGCGTQRCYFPNGFAHYLFARRMFDMSLTYDEILEDYFSHAYGEDWRLFRDYLKRAEECISFTYLSREESEDLGRSYYYSPTRAEKIKGIYPLCDEAERLIEAHYTSDRRVTTVSVRLLEIHVKFLRLLADALIPKALGNEDEAVAKGKILFDEMAKIEHLYAKYFDFWLLVLNFKGIFEQRFDIRDAEF